MQLLDLLGLGGGLRLIESKYMVVKVGERKVRRPWRDRLRRDFWRATTTEPIMGPAPTLYQIGPDTYVGHPVTIARLREQLAAGETGVS